MVTHPSHRAPRPREKCLDCSAARCPAPAIHNESPDTPSQRGHGPFTGPRHERGSGKVGQTVKRAARQLCNLLHRAFKAHGSRCGMSWATRGRGGWGLGLKTDKVVARSVRPQNDVFQRTLGETMVTLKTPPPKLSRATRRVTPKVPQLFSRFGSGVPKVPWNTSFL